MIVIGIDPGFGRLGCAVLKKQEENGLKIVKADCIKTKTGLGHEKRLLFIINELEKIVKKFKPALLGIERVFFTKNQKTAFQIAEVRGAILYLAAKNQIPIIELTPLEVKTALCGYGKADKKQVQEMVKNLLKLPSIIKQDDINDAVAIAITALSYKSRP
ncbi:MAG: crossover junction endodeoxyribonuclease RuvC [Promethearchaeota archaeon]